MTLTSFFVAWITNPCDFSHAPRSQAGRAWPMPACSSPVSCSSQPARLGGQCLEPVPLGAQPGQLGVVLPAGHDVRVQFPDPVADLLKLVLVVEALDQDEPLDRTPNVVP